jgi:GT2 family glycosyltransferase
MSKVAIGMISYNDLHFLKKALPEFMELCAYNDTKIYILDNAQNHEIHEFLKKKYPKIQYLTHPDGNTGFGKGHNYLIKKSCPSKYYFCVNSDIEIDKKGYKKCIDALDDDPNLFMVSGKLHHWDFKNNKKTDRIDTIGIVGDRSHNFYDWHQMEKDKGPYDDKKLFGISGAAFIIRHSMIREIYGDEDYLFDENMFMYKEDVDLAYKIQWLGMNMRMMDSVLGYHARTLYRKKKKSVFEKNMSYRNHLIMLFNNYSKKFSIWTKLAILWYEKKKFFYYLFTSPKVAFHLFSVLKMKKQKKLRIAKKKVPPKQIEQLLS